MQEEPINEAMQEEPINEAIEEEPINKEELTHEENKLLPTLLGITLGSVTIWIFN